jgi:hypothetical protein
MNSETNQKLVHILDRENSVPNPPDTHIFAALKVYKHAADPHSTLMSIQRKYSKFEDALCKINLEYFPYDFPEDSVSELFSDLTKYKHAIATLKNYWSKELYLQREKNFRELNLETDELNNELKRLADELKFQETTMTREDAHIYAFYLKEKHKEFYLLAQDIDSRISAKLDA